MGNLPSQASRTAIQIEFLRSRTGQTQFRLIYLFISFHHFRRRESERRDQAAANVIHPLSDAGAGKGVPLQPLPDPAAADRDRARAVPDGAADQDLVPEPADEVEEGAQDGLDERHAHAPDAPGARLPAPLAPAGHGHAPVRRPGAHAPRRGQGAVR